MENINYFYLKDENGDVVVGADNKPVFKPRPITESITTLEQSIKDGRPQRGIVATTQKVVDGLNWSHYDTYIADYEKWIEYCKYVNNHNNNIAFNVVIDNSGNTVQQEPLAIPPEPTLAEFELATIESVTAMVADTQWELNRKAGYGHWGDQLDEIYHDGVDSWKARIAAVKEQFPKP